jgi:hypothetical protein
MNLCKLNYYSASIHKYLLEVEWPTVEKYPRMACVLLQCPRTVLKAAPEVRMMKHIVTCDIIS